MRFISLFILPVFLFGCMTVPEYLKYPEQYESYGSNIRAVNYGSSVKIEYKSLSILQSEVKADAKLRRVKESGEAYIPKGGFVYLNIHSSTISAADTQYWEVIVEDMQGNELARRQGEPTVADYTIEHGMTFWHNLMITPVDHEVEGNFKVFVNDLLLKNQSEFIVTLTK
ncbi:hypothetical protein J9102_004292 [Vibrio vulnificus]|uniref:hypothetical protein n=1 Tax=Vibrio diabolicus TaxID=50719 RepID=UPI001D61D263|nr:hypothetical protein [Vibrio diabolicus]EHI9275059.1 hypothetical protein [Vibrio vulnificus]ELA9072568.1 hypothetical protein [Vibrio parahaemolyticus]ELA9307260.1 hypothetical protein [Vibrio parahaemolyticus]ELB2110476.1 hypothetical protein [Vibrio parahaemolyticus]MBM4969109.1 hypothetical protein [Vibrio parahaemolyticus]